MMQHRELLRNAEYETLLAKGLRKVSFPMNTIYTYMEQEGARRVLFTQVKPFAQEVWSSQFNNISLDGKTWHEALESLMYATGMVLRYVGGNSFVFCLSPRSSAL